MVARFSSWGKGLGDSGWGVTGGCILVGGNRQVRQTCRGSFLPYRHTGQCRVIYALAEVQGRGIPQSSFSFMGNSEASIILGGFLHPFRGAGKRVLRLSLRMRRKPLFLWFFSVVFFVFFLEPFSGRGLMCRSRDLLMALPRVCNIGARLQPRGYNGFRGVGQGSTFGRAQCVRVQDSV